MTSIVQCVPNFSTGKNKAEAKNIIRTLQTLPGIALLDYSSDEDHNRTVATFIGEPKQVEEAAFKAAEIASQIIDMAAHKGQHPRMGALDVCPFVPFRNISMNKCIEMAKNVGERIGKELSIPVYLYEKAAAHPSRQNLANVRKGEYESFFEKIKKPEWKPDFGPADMNIRSGCTAIGARDFLIAYNVNLKTDSLETAKKIAKKIRCRNGGLRYVKAIPVKLETKNIVQVSMNLVSHENTAIYQALEMIRMEAKRFGVEVIESEIIGTLPISALIDTAQYYLQIEDFSPHQILEYGLLECLDQE